MKAIGIFILVICCIGVESLPGVREKRETKGCSSVVLPRGKTYQVFYKGKWKALWQESREACQDLGGDLATISTREEQDDIVAALDKFPSDQYFWIGVKKNQGVPFWVSGKEMKWQDSVLDFPHERHHSWDEQDVWNTCGFIDWKGISSMDCDTSLVGYVCEFANGTSTVCIP